MGEEGDSEACLQLIADAKTAVEEMSYDKMMNIEENLNRLDAVVTKLAEDLEAQRKADELATGIYLTSSLYEEKDVYYDLSGRKAHSVVTGRIYIVNGKKVIKK